MENALLLPREKLETVKFALIQTEKLSYGCFLFSPDINSATNLVSSFMFKNSLNPAFFAANSGEKVVQLLENFGPIDDLELHLAQISAPETFLRIEL